MSRSKSDEEARAADPEPAADRDSQQKSLTSGRSGWFTRLYHSRAGPILVCPKGSFGKSSYMLKRKGRGTTVLNKQSPVQEKR